MQFRTAPGLYLLGAGASAGTAPLGRAFWTAPPLDFLRNLGGLSVAEPTHSPLTKGIVNNSSNITPFEVFPDREIRFGYDNLLFLEIIKRIPNFYTRLLLKNRLAKANFINRKSDSYSVFRLFSPSFIANYNHDGLASRLCGRRHRVLDMHGTIEREFGSPKIEDLIESVRDEHLPDLSDDILMGVPETWADQNLALRLLEISRTVPAFIAIIGYSFARNRDAHDDHVSLACFQSRFRGFQGNVYVIDPEPEYLRNLLSDSLKSNNIFPVRAYWNVLSHAIFESSRATGKSKSLNFIHEELLDSHGSGISFPIDRKW
ncbi:hypothetical protein [Oleomonas cavernae]|uniref:hypothetical protein n=1 Tax=Oleomonas cavernae TaxID=2320859 RepID=UPI0011C4430E|nr:hypothetical protein [Oleomonas cavernae]